jgi:hypothetical protein
MKRLIPLIFIAVLAGCNEQATTNVRMAFPKVPADLMTACPDLQTVDPNTEKLSDVLNVVTANYSQYYECKVKVDAWIEWYNTQKSINDTVTK